MAAKGRVWLCWKFIRDVSLEVAPPPPPKSSCCQGFLAGQGWNKRPRLWSLNELGLWGSPPLGVYWLTPSCLRALLCGVAWVGFEVSLSGWLLALGLPPGSISYHPTCSGLSWELLDASSISNCSRALLECPTCRRGNQASLPSVNLSLFVALNIFCGLVSLAGWLGGLVSQAPHLDQEIQGDYGIA